MKLNIVICNDTSISKNILFFILKYFKLCVDMSYHFYVNSHQETGRLNLTLHNSLCFSKILDCFFTGNEGTGQILLKNTHQQSSLGSSM